MDAVSPRFRPTRRQALGRGLCLGAWTALAALILTALVALAAGPPLWFWPLVASGPPVLGAAAGLLSVGRSGCRVSARGIRTPARVEPWTRVVDLRAERRGARTVVAVYLDSGVRLRLAAPYTGGLFEADPHFDAKVLELGHLWRCQRLGGVPC